MDVIATVPAAEREPWRTLHAVRLALSTWTVRQRGAAAAFSVVSAVLIGVPTVLIPNPVFGREIPVVAWNYPVWIATSVLAGMLAATYLRTTRARVGEAAFAPDVAERADVPGRAGLAGGLLTWFAVGCPVCNKIALLALGYSGALTWFAPAQPYLAAVAMLLTTGALLFRLRGQVYCPLPAVRRG